MTKGILGYLAILSTMFLLAGRIDYWQGWVYGASGLMVLLVIAILFCNKTDLIQERLKPGPGTKWWDKVFYACYLPTLLAIFVVASLDAGRFRSTPPLPLAVYSVGYLLMGFAYVMSFWAMWTNRFFSSVVRIQADRGHYVIQDGPYRFVRHPGYVGGMTLVLSIAVVLGSLWALIPSGMVVMLLVVRTALEDTALQRELPEYSDYAKKVQYRLLPGVW